MENHCRFFFKSRNRIELREIYLTLLFVDGSTIQTLLDKEDVLDKVTALLDRKENFWYPLGRKFGIERKELDYLKPEPIASPTKMMMKFIVGDQPLLSMKTFLEALAKINRFDVIKEMKKFFYGE